MRIMPTVKVVNMLNEDRAKIKLALAENKIKKEILLEATFEKLVNDLQSGVRSTQKLYAVTKKSLASKGAKAESISKFLDDIITKQTTLLKNVQNSKLSQDKRQKNAQSLKDVYGIIEGYVQTIVSIPNMLLSIKGFEDTTKEELDKGGKQSFNDLFPDESSEFKSNLQSTLNKNISNLLKKANIEVNISSIIDDLTTIPIAAFNDLTGQSRQTAPQIDQASQEIDKDNENDEDNEDVEELDVKEMEVVNNLFKFLKLNAKKDPAKIDTFLSKLKNAGIDLDQLQNMIK